MLCQIVSVVRAFALRDNESLPLSSVVDTYVLFREIYFVYVICI